METDQKIWILLARSASRLPLSQHLKCLLPYFIFIFTEWGGGLRWPCVKDSQRSGMFQSCIWMSRSYFRICSSYLGHLWFNASVNSTCAQPHPPPRADPRALAFFFPWMANSRGWGLLSCQIPQGGDENRGQMSLPPSTLQHFSLIAQSNNAILSILMCDLLFHLTSSFVIARGF